MERFSRLHELPGKIEMGEPGKPVINLCIVGAMVREQIRGPLFKGLTIVEGADYFCGVGYIHLGKPSLTEQQARPFIEKLSNLKTDEVICFHDDCYAMLTSLAAQYDLNVPFRPVHLFEYLYRMLSSGAERITPVGLRVAYQAPCASRYTPEKDHYLDELFELVGAKRVQREHEGLNGLCCGAPLMATDKERALEVKMRNINDARASQQFPLMNEDRVRSLSRAVFAGIGCPRSVKSLQLDSLSSSIQRERCPKPEKDGKSDPALPF